MATESRKEARKEDDPRFYFAGEESLSEGRGAVLWITCR